MNEKLTNSLRTILEHAKADRLGAMNDTGCVYHDPDTGRFCAIGCLLPEPVIGALIASGLNEQTGVDDLESEYEVLDGMGLGQSQAEALQAWHDASYADGGRRFKRTTAHPTPEDFQMIIEGLLDGTITRIRAEPIPEIYMTQETPNHGQFHNMDGTINEGTLIRFV